MLVPLDPIEACSKLIQACDGRITLSPALMANRLDGWEFLDVRGAVVMRKGPEVHAAAPDAVKGCWITRPVIKAVLVDTLKRFGHVVTSVSDDNSAGHEFVKRLGFVESGHTPSCTYYTLRECRHA